MAKCVPTPHLAGEAAAGEVSRFQRMTYLPFFGLAEA